jgi:lysozyme family protein
MQADYQPFIARLIDRYEGGYGWDKGDPGGPTKYGITCYDLAEHRHQKMTSMATWAPIVQAMSRPEAEQIYATKYANGIQFDYLNPGCDTVLLDYGVNSGDSRPIRVARALLKVDGGPTMTPDLVAAVNKADQNWFIDAVCTERLYFMHQIRQGTAWAKFGGGWGARVADLKTYSKALVTRTIPPSPKVPISPVPKANNDATDINATVTKSTAGGAIAAGTAAHLSGLPYWAVGGIVAVILLVVVLTMVRRSNAATTANQTVVLPASIPPQPRKS